MHVPVFMYSKHADFHIDSVNKMCEKYSSNIVCMGSSVEFPRHGLSPVVTHPSDCCAF